MGGYYVAHIEKAPETGRRRFMAVSKETEVMMRKQALEETLKQFEGRILPLDHPITQAVRRITQRIIAASNLGHLKGDFPEPEPPDFWSANSGFSAAEIPHPPTINPDQEWVVLVVNDMEFVNAFAAPGLVCVSTGIMPVARDEDGLAAIIGHEIGHVTMRHSAEEMSQNMLFFPIIGLLFLIGIDPLLSTTVAKYFHSLPHSRALETEGEWAFANLMSRACYDPAAAPRFFEDLQKLEKNSVPKFFNTHPPTPERIATLYTLLSESYNIYNANPECAQLAIRSAIQMDPATLESTVDNLRAMNANFG
ncbi:peptidase family M48-domain-containing protein [Mycena pura]|uniref:Peptidase family M48-domain-containing protein n=1 Tax=Mycena pura TaxID=153505 RepID=A0AAD6VJ39_9AGAR|nr:peptidase family M48-domain-containing protein [Mycena pura]